MKHRALTLEHFRKRYSHKKRLPDQGDWVEGS
jgi:hypothetical protein